MKLGTSCTLLHRIKEPSLWQYQLRVWALLVIGKDHGQLLIESVLYSLVFSFCPLAFSLLNGLTLCDANVRIRVLFYHTWHSRGVRQYSDISTVNVFFVFMQTTFNFVHFICLNMRLAKIFLTKYITDHGNSPFNGNKQINGKVQWLSKYACSFLSELKWLFTKSFMPWHTSARVLRKKWEHSSSSNGLHL